MARFHANPGSLGLPDHGPIGPANLVKRRPHGASWRHGANPGLSKAAAIMLPLTQMKGTSRVKA
jgi:hypothetical protein